jgi:hypothetical protein
MLPTKTDTCIRMRADGLENALPSYPQEKDRELLGFHQSLFLAK